MSRQRIFVLLAFLLALLPTTNGANAAQSSADSDVIKTYCTAAYGYAGSDELKADLLLNAKRLAVNELFGEQIVASTAVENFVVTADQIRTSSIGFVRIRGSAVYYNGENLAEVCVRITAYATAEDRAKFAPVDREKRLCLTEPTMTVNQLRRHVQQETVAQMLIDYDRRLGDVVQETLLQLARKVVYAEAGFAPGTDSFCVTAQAEVIPVEVLALVEGTEPEGTAMTPTPTKRSTATPRPTRPTMQATGTPGPSGGTTEETTAGQPRPAIKVSGQASMWEVGVVQTADIGAPALSALPDALQERLAQALPRLRVTYGNSIEFKAVSPLPAELAANLATVLPRLWIEYANTSRSFSLRFPHELLYGE